MVNRGVVSISNDVLVMINDGFLVHDEKSGGCLRVKSEIQTGDG